ncbi:MAG: GNAT family N-acetyltransferase, partial [Halobacteriales archaeon]
MADRPDPDLDDAYAVVERPPTPEEFQALRAANDMARRSRAAVEQGLPNSLYSVVLFYEPSGETVGMGRIVGDDGAVFHVTDMAVHPNHQGLGLGTAVMNALLEYIEATAPPRAYVNLMADVDGFYERFGFE